MWLSFRNRRRYPFQAWSFSFKQYYLQIYLIGSWFLLVETRVFFIFAPWSASCVLGFCIPYYLNTTTNLSRRWMKKSPCPRRRKSWARKAFPWTSRECQARPASRSGASKKAESQTLKGCRWSFSAGQIFANLPNYASAVFVGVFKQTVTKWNLF